MFKIVITIFKGCTSFIVIIKYWPYSPCCTIYPHNLFILYHKFVGFFVFFFLLFLGSHPRHIGGSQARGRIGIQLLAYSTTTATQGPSHVCDLHYNSLIWQCQILNPLSESSDQTHNLKVPSQIHFRYAMTGTPIVWTPSTLTPILPLPRPSPH